MLDRTLNRVGERELKRVALSVLCLNRGGGRHHDHSDHADGFPMETSAIHRLRLFKVRTGGGHAGPPLRASYL